MKYYKFLNIMVFLLVAAACGSVDRRDDPGVKKAIVEGVIHVQNPGTLQTSPRIVTLEEELSIGDGQDRDYFLARPRGLLVDHRDNIYILDAKLLHVKKFAGNGCFIGCFSQKGQGPGEVLLPADFELDNKNKQIAILDSKNSKVTRYGLDGSFIDDLKLEERYPARIFPAPGSGYLVLHSAFDDKGNRSKKMVRYSYSGSILGSSTNFKTTLQKIHKIGDYFISFGTPFDPEGHFACDRKGNIYYGFSDRYEIHVYDAGFKKIRVVTKGDPGTIPVAKEQKDIFLERLRNEGNDRDFFKVRDFPTHYPFFSGVWVDDRDRLLVRTPSLDDSIHIDVFTPGGSYVEKLIIIDTVAGISLENDMAYPVFKGDFLYCLVKDREGEYFIKKYRLGQKADG